MSSFAIVRKNCGCAFFGQFLRKGPGLRAYKIELEQQLKPIDDQSHRTFDEWTQNELTTNPNFHKNI